MPKWTKEQQQAIDEEGKNIIVSAGAGSGKTAVLTERVIKKLESGIDINKLLVLTFTNEAANEMKERIRKAIKKQPNLKKQLDYIDSSYITTFDSYAFSIVKKYNYTLNVSKNIQIIDQSIINIIRNTFLDEIFEEQYQKKDKKFVKLINDFCIKDDKEMKNAIIKINNKLELKIDKEEYLNNYINNFFNDNYINNIVNSYILFLKTKVSEIKNKLETIRIKEDNATYEKYANALAGLIEANNYDEIKTAIEIKLPILKKNSPIKEEKDSISEVLKELKTLTIEKNEISLKENYISTKEYIQIIINIINELDNKIKKYKTINDCYEFTDISKMAINIVKNNEDVKNEIKYFYNEIMVDEYQDTSDLQEIFINQIENNNVYMVGDIKQSIYRFRNANPNIFKNKYDKYSKNENGIKIDLLKNFRSRSEVLDDINIIFNKIMDNKIGGADYSVSHQMVYGNETYTHEGTTTQNNNLEIMNYYNEEKKYSNLEIEIFTIANDIKNKIENKYQILDKNTNKLRNISYDDICIILDRGTDFPSYQKIFEYLGIPLTVFQDEDLTSGTDIILIKNILEFILKINNKEYDQKFKYLYVSIARSYLFEYTDEEIFDCFVKNDFINNEIYLLSKDLSKSLNEDTSFNVIEKIVKSFKIIEKTKKIGDIAKTLIKVEYLKQIADNLDSLGYTPNMLMEYLTEMINSDDCIKYKLNTKDNLSVKIMNIHKSKGLEFSICYYAGLYKSFNTSDIKERFLYTETYGIITPYFKEGIGTVFTKYLAKQIYNIEEISEKIRLFYVAVTRAKEKMIIVASLKNETDNKEKIIKNDVRLKYNSFLDIINSIKDELTDKITNIDIEKINITKDYNKIKKINYKEFINDSNIIIEKRHLIIDEQTKEKSHFSKTVNKVLSEKEKETLALGTEIHKAFEIADFKNIDSSNIKYKDKIIDFLNHNELKNIKEAKIYKEYEFINETSEEVSNGIIDLILEYDSNIKIIDYKLNDIDKEEYKKQLKGYKTYIESISNKKVNTYLYSIMQDILKET